MTRTPARSVSLTVLLAGPLLLALPFRASLSPSAAARSQGSPAQPSSTSLPQVTATVPLDPEAGVELRVTLLLTEPMVVVSSQETCRIVTTLSYCQVRGEVEDSIDLETNRVDPDSAETVKSWVDAELDGVSSSYEVSLTPVPGTSWGEVKGLEDVAIQTREL